MTDCAILIRVAVDRPGRGGRGGRTHSVPQGWPCGRRTARTEGKHVA